MQFGLIASRQRRQLAIVAAGCALVAASTTVSAHAEPSAQPPLGRANFSTPTLDPADGETVGIAAPVIISFTAAIDDKATAEKAIRVSTEPEVEGHYRWVGNKELRWKPNGFWPAGTKVGVQAGSAASAFTIGDEWVATADDNTHTLTVTVDGASVRTMPISMGANENPTPNGTYTVGERFADMYMDSSVYGVPVDSPGGYRTYVEYAARLSNSGIFLHAAPWSVGQQGNTNVSRGCINVSTDDGRWFFENAPKGAPVIVSNTVGGTIDPTDGLTDFTAP
ncbi:L,D-transpeptidase [Nocardia sp. 348MFTsu5.1]|uniref:L,D-transpeptidase n=1 Tax=Nocardia sp. 348MFTsu5.1 TaxID=1172185 RepID=UPI000377D43F|nr:L,D-transpeptidase [Nocardia sp. 348MFTsu5.1]